MLPLIAILQVHGIFVYDRKLKANLNSEEKKTADKHMYACITTEKR